MPHINILWCRVLQVIDALNLRELCSGEHRFPNPMVMVKILVSLVKQSVVQIG
jgi:hypothetical protein